MRSIAFRPFVRRRVQIDFVYSARNSPLLPADVSIFINVARSRYGRWLTDFCQTEIVLLDRDDSVKESGKIDDRPRPHDRFAVAASDTKGESRV